MGTLASSSDVALSISPCTLRRAEGMSRTSLKTRWGERYGRLAFFSGLVKVESNRGDVEQVEGLSLFKTSATVRDR